MISVKITRKVKNIVMIGMVVVFAGVSVLTMNFIGDSKAGAPPQLSSQSSMQQPPGMQSGGQSSDNNSGSSDNQNNQPPQMFGGNSENGSSDNQNNQPPQMNGNSQSDNSSSDDSDRTAFVPDNNNENNNFPGKGINGSSKDNNSNNNNSDNNNSNESNSDNNNSGNGFVPDNGQNQNGNNNRPDGFDQGGFEHRGGSFMTVVKYSALTADSLIIAALVMYLILSGFNKRGFRDTLRGAKRVLIFILCTAIIGAALAGAQIAVCELITSGAASSHQHMQLPGNSQQNNSFQQNGSDKTSASSVSASGKTTVTDTKTLSDDYSSTESDVSAVLVENGGNATINGSKIEKSGDSTNTENSEFYGVNAGVLVTKNSTATIKNAEIKTSAKGSNAVFSTGENSKIYVSNTKITTTGEGSARGLDATYGGYIEADNVTVNTKGGSCAALATDRGEGTVKVKNSDLTTNGAGSPVIYSTGDISVTNTKGTANGSQITVVEGKNSATIKSSTMTASGAGNRNNVDNAGVMIYQSMSGDAGEGKGTFTAEYSTLSIKKSSSLYKTAPMFFITNTDADINLKNTKLDFGSGVLINAEGTSEWGNSGSNGGNVTLNAENQKLTGDIKADSISTVTLNLTKSNYKGTINGDNSAKSVTLKLDKSSKITLTGNTYVTSLDNADKTNSNIDLNGYKLYVNGKAI